MGLGKGIFSELKLTHLIGSSRTTEDYILRLHEGHAISKEVFDFIGGALPSRRSRLSRLKYALDLASTGGFQRRIRRACERGRIQGRKQLASIISTNLTS